MSRYVPGLVSIITPSYNSLCYIDEAINSVFEQTYTNWELVIIDDCSNDGSYDVICAYARKDSRIKVFRMDVNSGPAVCRNKAMQIAQGQYVAILDSDDIWMPGKLDKQLSLFAQSKPAVVYSYYEKIAEDGSRDNRVIKSKQVNSYSDLLKTNSIGNLTAIVDRFLTGNIQIPIVPAHEDYAFWLSLAKSGFTFMCLPEVTALYRCHSNSFSANKWKVARSQWLIYRKVEKLPFISSVVYFLQYFLNGIFKTFK